MKGFEFFRETGRRYIPKTTAGALRAFDAHMLPVEGYLYAATSVRPLDEAPYDIDEIERVLGRDNLDGESNLLLVKILRHLLESPEQEVALFAAEGINLIESRYAKKIEKVRAELAREPDAQHERELAALSEEVAGLYLPGSSIRAFYLHEAYRLLVAVRDRGVFEPGDALRLARLLIDLGLADQAASVLESLPPRGQRRLLLEAEIEFERRRYSRVWEICSMLEGGIDALDGRGRAILSYWLDGDGA